MQLSVNAGVFYGIYLPSCADNKFINPGAENKRIALRSKLEDAIADIWYINIADWVNGDIRNLKASGTVDSA